MPPQSDEDRARRLYRFGKAGHAVVRNRVRRRLREIYRLHRSALKPDMDIVIVARTRCVGAEYQKLESAFLDACRKLGLLSEERA